MADAIPVKLVNLTGAIVHVVGDHGVVMTLDPDCGWPNRHFKAKPRCETVKTEYKSYMGFRFQIEVFDESEIEEENIPHPKDDFLFIVTKEVADRHPSRTDFIVPIEECNYRHSTKPTEIWYRGLAIIKRTPK